MPFLDSLSTRNLYEQDLRSQGASQELLELLPHTTVAFIPIQFRYQRGHDYILESPTPDNMPGPKNHNMCEYLPLI